MGRLFLVRHAQASFLSQNYDQLSPLGGTQARLLGQYWAQHHVLFDRVGTGPGPAPSPDRATCRRSLSQSNVWRAWGPLGARFIHREIVRSARLKASVQECKAREIAIARGFWKTTLMLLISKMDGVLARHRN